MGRPRQRLASEQNYQRLRQQVKVYMVVTLAAVIASGIYEHSLAPLAAAALLVGFYPAWMWRMLPRLDRSDERLSLQESMTSQAQAHGAVDCSFARAAAPRGGRADVAWPIGGNRRHSGSFRWDRRAACGIKPEPRKFGAA